jgi:microcystin-dependent protein
MAKNVESEFDMVNWRVGMSPSAVSPSGRAMMSSAARWRDDVAGSLVTTGSAQNYQISSNQQFDSLADFNGQVISFQIHATNTSSPVTMSVDSIGANLPLRSAPNTELLPGTLVQGTSYDALFNNTDGALYLKNFFGPSPYLIPLGAMIDYFGTSSPNSSLALPFGQAISRTTYAALFALIGTTYGVGDGSTTFNLPDLRGRVSPGADNMGGTAAGRLTTATMSGSGVGATGGAETETAPLPAHSHGVNDPSHVHGIQLIGNVGSLAFPAAGTSNSELQASTLSATTGISIQSAGSGMGVHPNVQPALLVNKLLRII